MFKPIFVAVLSVVCSAAQTAATADGGKRALIQFQDPTGFALGSVTGPILFADPANSVVHLIPKGVAVTGAPYSGQSTTERVQILADGNRIDQTTSSTVARDSEGRTRIERTLSGPTSDNGGSPQIVTIEDPVSGYSYTLDTAHKVAFRTPMPKGSAGAEKIGDKAQVKPLPIFKNSSVDMNVVESDLGSQTIEGVIAQGRRITRTIPAGSIGNQNPIVITTETWYSPDLNVLVMSKSNDPRIGETTYALSNIQRSDPGPSLFQIPADYSVQDQPAKNVVYQKMTTTAK